MSENKKLGRRIVPDEKIIDGLKFISVKKFAELRKVSTRTIQNYIKAEKILEGVINENGSFMIQIELAERELEMNLDLKNSLRAVGNHEEIKRLEDEEAKVKPLPNVTSSVQTPAPPQPKKEKKPKEPKMVKEPPAEIIPGVASFAVSRAKSEAAKAELAQMELDLRKDKYLDKAKVSNQAFEEATRIKEALLNIPSRISAEITALRDQGEVEIFLENEIRLVLLELSK